MIFFWIKAFKLITFIFKPRDSSSETESDEEIPRTKKKQQKYDPDMWESAPVLEVSQLPEGMDGLVVYNIRNISNAKDKQAALATDGRKWKKSSVTQWKKYGPMRYANCDGSYKCTNDKCPFKAEYGVTNRSQFKCNPSGEKICRICESVSEFISCTARRYIRDGKKSVKVFHVGTHTCPLLPKPEKPTQKIREMFKKNPKLTACEIQSSLIMSSLRKGQDWETVENTAATIVDRKWISNQKQNVKKEIHPSGENFEAVVTFKQYCDKKDKLLVYKVNDNRGNPDMPSFVFKTSQERMEIAMKMDKDGEHFLRDEYCYFDGKVKRCKDYVTLTASTYHPLLKKQIPLAIMETQKENSENIELFWNLFNKALKVVAGDDTATFNPIGFCTDMTGANMNGLKNVFGEDVLTRIKSCEFHFKESRNRMAKKLNDDDEELFKELCDKMLELCLESAYQSAKRTLENFIEEASERKFLRSWLDWWDNRKVFIFHAFAPTKAPKMNLAEVIHAGWSNRDAPNLTLLDAAQTDAKDSILLAAELKAIEKGNLTAFGQGPSFQEKSERAHHQELARAVQLGKDIVGLSDFQVDPNSGHRPPASKKSSQSTKRDTKKQASKRPSQQPSASTQHQVTTMQTLKAFIEPVPNPSINGTATSSLPNLGASLHSFFGAGGVPQFGSEVTQGTSQYPLAPSTSQSASPALTNLLQSSGVTGVSPHYGLGQSFVPQQAAFPESWHSGHSPYRYEVVRLPTRAQKCYGCGMEFAEKYRQPPYNIVVKHVDRRLVRRDERTGLFLYSPDYSNTYYHLDSAHIARKNPFLMEMFLFHLKSGKTLIQDNFMS